QAGRQGRVAVRNVAAAVNGAVDSGYSVVSVGVGHVGCQDVAGRISGLVLEHSDAHIAVPVRHVATHRVARHGEEDDATAVTGSALVRIGHVGDNCVVVRAATDHESGMNVLACIVVGDGVAGGTVLAAFQVDAHPAAAGMVGGHPDLYPVEHEQASVAVACQRVALDPGTGDCSDNQTVAHVVPGVVPGEEGAIGPGVHLGSLV